MIVLPDDPAHKNATEQTPLKSSAGPSEPSHPTQSPPPYTITPTPPGPPSQGTHSYRTGLPPPPPPAPAHSPNSFLPPPPQVPAPGATPRALRRAGKAYLTALLIIFLWSLFLASVEERMHLRVFHPGPLVHNWVQDAIGFEVKITTRPSRSVVPIPRNGGEPCECYTVPPPLNPTPTPTQPAQPAFPTRVLPIFYPPVLKNPSDGLPLGLQAQLERDPESSTIVRRELLEDD
ncbi:hypothetical protein DFP72DRAFT_879947 [Ephemerocybe angulata]|uniref:Uncharacterized protein n=1 Tax=Ephemerocybe angulata TaxID=980116 RepID=A0A8H6I8U1_9AGAR|nr:hypothetical protein DFP72DRAFT_879947 [Tulosesus angulatus]